MVEICQVKLHRNPLPEIIEREEGVRMELHTSRGVA